MADALDVEDREIGWIPPPVAVTHNGEPIPDDMDFFCPPPRDIGEVRTARSTLKSHKSEMNPLSVWLIRIGVAGAAATGGYYTGEALSGPFDGPALKIVLTTLSFLLAGLVAILVTRFKHTCSYTASGGAVEYTISGSRSARPRERKLLFESASELRSKQTHQYSHGIYTSTLYEYIWRGADDRTLLKLNGSYHSKKNTPKATNPFWFASATEQAWNAHVSDRMQAELERKGYVEFRVNKKDLVRVGPGFIEFVFSGKEVRVPGEEIGEINVRSGAFTIKTKDARWFSSAGKFSFNYGAMSNAQMFLFALSRLLGYTFE